MLSLTEVYSMTNPTPLSPAAQAVLDAATERWLDVDDDIPAQVTAAALRAAADQVVPVPEHLLEFGIRKQLLAIAAELEGAQ